MCSSESSTVALVRSLAVVLLLVGCQPAVGAKDGLEIVTGGARKTDRLPVIVALHGYGGAPEEITRLFDTFTGKARVIAPHGAERAHAGWGWFPADRPAYEHPERVAAASDRVVAAIAHAPAGCGKPIVIGFSQGGMLSWAVAARAPERILAAIPLAGLLPNQLWPKKTTSPPPVFAYHGDADNVVPLDEDEMTRDAFVAAGYAVTFKRMPNVRHRVTPEMVSDLYAVLEKLMRDEGCWVN